MKNVKAKRATYGKRSRSILENNQILDLDQPQPVDVTIQKVKDYSTTYLESVFKSPQKITQKVKRKLPKLKKEQKENNKAVNDVSNIKELNDDIIIEQVILPKSTMIQDLNSNSESNSLMKPKINSQIVDVSTRLRSAVSRRKFDKSPITSDPDQFEENEIKTVDNVIDESVDIVSSTFPNISCTTPINKAVEDQDRLYTPSFGKESQSPIYKAVEDHLNTLSSRKESQSLSVEYFNSESDEQKIEGNSTKKLKITKNENNDQSTKLNIDSSALFDQFALDEPSTPKLPSKRIHSMKPSNIDIPPKLDLYQELSASTMIIDNTYEEREESNAEFLKAPTVFISSFQKYTSRTYGKQNSDVYPQLNTSISATNIAYDDDDEIFDEGLESSDDEVILF
jgi:hypothetical protein